MRKLSHEEIVSRQSIRKHNPKLALTVILNNIRSLYNVGSIFRTADGVGVQKIWLCGYTGCPPNSQIAKTALGAESEVPWEYHKDAFSLIKGLKEKGYKIILLEQLDQSVPHDQLSLDSPACLVLGNEISGVDDQIVSTCDTAVEIEMAGVKNSLNVAVAFGILAYHLRNQLKASIK